MSGFYVSTAAAGSSSAKCDSTWSLIGSPFNQQHPTLVSLGLMRQSDCHGNTSQRPVFNYRSDRVCVCSFCVKYLVNRMGAHLKGLFLCVRFNCSAVWNMPNLFHSPILLQHLHLWGHTSKTVTATRVWDRTLLTKYIRGHTHSHWRRRTHTHTHRIHVQGFYFFDFWGKIATTFWTHISK